MAGPGGGAGVEAGPRWRHSGASAARRRGEGRRLKSELLLRIWLACQDSVAIWKELGDSCVKVLETLVAIWLQRWIQILWPRFSLHRNTGLHRIRRLYKNGEHRGPSDI
jgi:hypothetical protein